MINNETFIIGRDEKILVTGSNGFVGKNVVRTLLFYGFENIRCLIRAENGSESIKITLGGNKPERLEFINGNLLSRDVCANAVKDISIIYHLAAGTEKSYAGCFMNSVVGTRNLLDATLKENKVKRFVNVSSIAVYGVPNGSLLDEACPIEKCWFDRYEPYTYGKAKQDELVLKYAQNCKLPYVIVRPSVVFGPGKAKISDRIGTAMFGLFLHLGLNNRIPLTYVENCADAIVLSGLRKGIEGEVFNIVDDDLPRSREFLRLYKKRVRSFLSIPVPYPFWFLFCSLWEKYSKWSEGQLPPIISRRICSVYWKKRKYSNAKAKEILGWHPKIGMNEGMNRYFVFAREETLRN